MNELTVESVRTQRIEDESETLFTQFSSESTGASLIVTAIASAAFTLAVVQALFPPEDFPAERDMLASLVIQLQKEATSSKDLFE